jgi:hypothetical protein
MMPILCADAVIEASVRSVFTAMAGGARLALRTAHPAFA